MSMGGKGPEVLVTLTTDFGKVLDGLHRTKIRGSTHLATGIQVAGVSPFRWMEYCRNTVLSLLFAQLALKHRQNKQQRQRIIVFTCSPIAEDEKSLEKLAKKMKKNNVSIDFIAFGDLDPENTQKLEAFHENIKGGESSHLAIIPPGPNLLSDHLVTTPILGGDGTGARAGEGAGGEGGETGSGGFEFGVDPSTDPELALALRMSFEEEKARLEKEKKEREEKEGKSNLEGIPEEGGDASQPLLNQNAEPSGSTADDETGKKDKADDTDKMDTA